jgi:hypothetical protein
MELLNLVLFATCLGLGVWVWQLRRKLASMDDLALGQHWQISDLATDLMKADMELTRRKFTIDEMAQRNLLDQDEIIYRIKCTDEFKNQWIDYLRAHRTDIPFAQWVREVYLGKPSKGLEPLEGSQGKEADHV